LSTNVYTTYNAFACTPFIAYYLQRGAPDKAPGVFVEIGEKN